MKRAASTWRPILWKRKDASGFESSRVTILGSHRQVEGVAVFFFDGNACRLDYDIRCSSEWITRDATVSGWVGSRAIEIVIARSVEGEWTLNDQRQPAASGCDDIDLNFSPSTNLLPIRRLELAVGSSAIVRAAWLRFPEFLLEPLTQTYRRLDRCLYRYQAGPFVADLSVDDEGQVIEYAEWSRIGS